MTWASILIPLAIALLCKVEALRLFFAKKNRDLALLWFVIGTAFLMIAAREARDGAKFPQQQVAPIRKTNA